MTDTPQIKPSMLIQHSGMLLWLAIAVSLLVHVVIGVMVYRAPLTRVDISMLEVTRSPTRIKRANFDFVSELVGEGSYAVQADVEPLTLEDTARELIDLREESLRTEQTDLPQEADAQERPVDVADFLEADSTDVMEAAMAGVEPEGLADMEFAGFTRGAGTAVGTLEGGSLAAELLAAAGMGGETETRNDGADVRAAREAFAIAEDRPARQATTLPELEQDVQTTSRNIDLMQFIELRDQPALMPQQLDQDFQYILTRYEPNGREGYFRVDIIPQPTLRRLQTMPKDMVFMVDTSASLSQNWVNQMARGVRSAMSSLNPQDRFNVVLFSDRVHFFNEAGNVPATAENIAAAQRFLFDTKSEGSTNVNAALSRLLVRDVEVERAYTLVMLSDGIPTVGVIDTRELINVVTRDNDRLAGIYSIAVGDRKNIELLDFLSYRNKGFSITVDDFPQTAPAVQALASWLRYPLIKDVRVNVIGVNAQQVFPKELPNIHQGETFSIYGRYDQRKPFTMHITGTNMGRPVSFTFTRDLRDAREGDSTLARNWAFWKLQHMYSEIIRRGELPELKRQIDQLRREYRIRTLY